MILAEGHRDQASLMELQDGRWVGSNLRSGLSLQDESCAVIAASCVVGARRKWIERAATSQDDGRHDVQLNEPRTRLASCHLGHEAMYLALETVLKKKINVI
ncbi:hypothetical protein DTO013E5_9162 [Penicillium roqueforti]|nr:hypothetical protein DTO012A1_8698 [Penicillium roqueforti]KAI2740266.1 hypothetical protein DTO013F2_9149 [Penicillium roqueforti]KAI2756306.1 hypothetical protein DTO006G1_7946 [Penicillium roqueforti]KAI2766732.1 hypothetical protein DTO012A8_8042 [Penicillium roqueforti]KAI3199891.1 hypothetical protein DTO013E5_9162 [Penicillium roqueforti]